MDQLAKFMKAEQLTREKIFLALTFGFPLVQKGLEKGFLAKWTKGFKCTNVVGNDVVQLLRDAIERKGVCVDCLKTFFKNRIFRI